MRIFTPNGPLPGFGLAPMFLGAMFALTGLLIWIFPDLLQALVGGALIAIGAALIGVGWTARSAGVRYRRINRVDEWEE